MLFLSGLGLLHAAIFPLREDAAGVTYDPDEAPLHDWLGLPAIGRGPPEFLRIAPEVTRATALHAKGGQSSAR